MQNIKKTTFKIGMPLESGTCYYGDKSEYHIYLKDTVYFTNFILQIFHKSSTRSNFSFAKFKFQTRNFKLS